MSAIARTRSRQPRVEGPMLVRGFESFVRPLPLADAARHDQSASSRACSTRRSASAPISRSSRWRAGPAACTSTRPGIPFVLPSRTSDARFGDRLSGTVLFEGPTSPKGAHDQAVRALGARGGCGALRRWPERAGDAGVHFRPAVFEPTFHKHAQTSCGGCQITCSIARRSSVEAGVALNRRVPRRRSRPLSAGAIRRTSTSTRSCVRHPGGSAQLREQIGGGLSPAATSPGRGPTASRRSNSCGERFLLYR